MKNFERSKKGLLISIGDNKHTFVIYKNKA